MFFFKGKGLCINPYKSWHWFCSKASVGPRHYWVLFWRYGQSTNSWTRQGLYHLMGTAVRYGRPYSFYASWIWMQGTHFVFSVLSFCFRLHSKAGRSSSWCCFFMFFSLCWNLGVARPPYKGECQGTRVAMPKTNVRNGQRATFQHRFFLWNKLYLIVYDLKFLTPMLGYVADKSDKLFLWVQVKPYLSGSRVHLTHGSR